MRFPKDAHPVSYKRNNVTELKKIKNYYIFFFHFSKCNGLKVMERKENERKLKRGKKKRTENGQRGEKERERETRQEKERMWRKRGKNRGGKDLKSEGKIVKERAEKNK